jgi:hypothetical protein
VTNVTLPTGKALLDQKDKIVAAISDGTQAAGPVNVFYFDGNPAAGTPAFTQQLISYIAPDQTYTTRAFYTPRTCGQHSIYVVASTEASQSSFGPVNLQVTMDGVDAVDGLLASVEADKLSPEIARQLERILKAARYYFTHGKAREGVRILKYFEGDVRRRVKNDETADSLIAQDQSSIECIIFGSDRDSTSESLRSLSDASMIQFTDQARELIRESGVSEANQ